MKLLISELQPAEGVIWRHQSMRLTYVAQHAVHQLEERQDKIEESWLAPWFIRPKTLDIKDDNAEAKKERAAVRSLKETASMTLKLWKFKSINDIIPVTFSDCVGPGSAADGSSQGAHVLCLAEKKLATGDLALAIQ